MTTPLKIVRLATLKTVEDFRAHVRALNIDLHCEDSIALHGDSPLCQPLKWGSRTIGNRWAIQPMEGWDGTTSGGVTDLIVRRWKRFGESGAKLIWGGEAMAVCPEGRANTNQIIINETNKAGIAGIREALVAAHREKFGSTDDLVIGFQLTHSGRFCRPNDKKRWESRIAFRHPILDRKFNVQGDDQILTDDAIRRLIDQYVSAAQIAAEAGADFVDIKHCHGYLLHEFLGAHTRPGPFGGSFENRTRILREIVSGIRCRVPGLGIGVRLSAFDFVPFKPNPALAEQGKLGPGMPEDYSHCLPYRYAFGINPDNPVEMDLTETVQFVELLRTLGIGLVNFSAGSPYYNPHIQRPAAYPPSDGYQPHEDPLAGVARQINAVKFLKSKAPSMIVVGSAYSYLQEYMPHVAQHYVRQGHVDIVGIGRMVLSYPGVLADATRNGKMETRLICRTFSDCTTAPRNGLRSGCYPLDEFYKKFEDAGALKEAKKIIVFDQNQTDQGQKNTMVENIETPEIKEALGIIAREKAGILPPYASSALLGRCLEDWRKLYEDPEMGWGHYPPRYLMGPDMYLSKAFAELATHPVTLAAARAVLGDCQLASYHLVATPPNSTEKADWDRGNIIFHVDHVIYSDVPVPQSGANAFACVWVNFEEMTLENGPLCVAVGTDRWNLGPELFPSPHQLTPDDLNFRRLSRFNMGPAGTAGVYSGKTWHAPTPNASTRIRRGLQIDFVPLRPEVTIKQAWFDIAGLEKTKYEQVVSLLEGRVPVPPWDPVQAEVFREKHLIEKQRERSAADKRYVRPCIDRASLAPVRW
ncbi:MAG: phytanoyl-CoA dioxygenase family protein [Verrucomicrobiae bacterium]|nr:phytanoyl-CoA dioxygenase family protein [Verrucomicrobiae bacterium]